MRKWLILITIFFSRKTNPSKPASFGGLARTTFLVYNIPSQEAINQIRNLNCVRRVPEIDYVGYV